MDVSILLSNALLSILSIINMGLIGSMLAWLHGPRKEVYEYALMWKTYGVGDEKTYTVGYFVIEPEHLWLGQSHLSIFAAVFGFVIGFFGLFVAWRQGKRHNQTRSKTLLGLTILQFLAILVTVAALIFVFTVTSITRNQHISKSDVDFTPIYYPNYAKDEWTPETWLQAVLELPFGRSSQEHKFEKHVRLMKAWRWMLVPILLATVAAFGVSMLKIVRQRRGRAVERLESSTEKHLVFPAEECQHELAVEKVQHELVAEKFQHELSTDEQHEFSTEEQHELSGEEQHELAAPVHGDQGCSI